MVAYFPMRTYGINQAIRFVKGIWLHRKSRQLQFCFSEETNLLHVCATCSEPQSYRSSKYHGLSSRISGERSERSNLRQSSYLCAAITKKNV